MKPSYLKNGKEKELVDVKLYIIIFLLLYFLAVSFTIQFSSNIFKNKKLKESNLSFYFKISLLQMFIYITSQDLLQDEDNHSIMIIIICPKYEYGISTKYLKIITYTTVTLTNTVNIL